jgi:pimeloyl-ACP methyl ester carboxylesterase
LDGVQFTDLIAHVPSIAVPPPSARPDTPLVVTWHLLDAPRTHQGMAAAIPLDGLDAWRVHLALPRSIGRGVSAEEMMRRGYEDAVMNIQGPTVDEAAAEFPAVLDALRDRLGAGGPLAVVGGSMGTAVAQQVAIDRPDVVAAVLISPIAQLRAAVRANEARFGVTYAWHAAAEAVADRQDFVARACETARSAPAVRIIVGAEDDEQIREPATALHAALAAGYADPTRVDLVTVPGMAHALADEDERPLPCAADVDRLAVDWLRRHLR